MNFPDPWKPEQEELTPEVEYLLLSEPANHTALARVLTSEYYFPLLRLALHLFDDPEDAATAALEVLVQACLRASSYREGLPAKIWVHRIARRIYARLDKRITRRRRWLRYLPFFARPADFGVSEPVTVLDAALWLGLDGQPYEHRLALILSVVEGWGAEDIAIVLGRSVEDTGDLFAKAWAGVYESPRAAGQQMAGEEEGGLREMLKRSLADRWSAGVYGAIDLEAIAAEVAAQAAHLAQRSRRSIRLREAMFVLMMLPLALGVLWVVNEWAPLPEPAPEPAARPVQQVQPTLQPTPAYPEPLDVRVYLQVESGDTWDSLAEALGVSWVDLAAWNGMRMKDKLETGMLLRVELSSAPWLAMNPARGAPAGEEPEWFTEPLTGNEMRRFFAESEPRWVTLWADIDMVDYGPLGYRGPFESYSRRQVWAGDRGRWAVESEGERYGGLLMLAGRPFRYTINPVWEATIGDRDVAVDMGNLPPGQPPDLWDQSASLVLHRLYPVDEITASYRESDAILSSFYNFETQSAASWLLKPISALWTADQGRATFIDWDTVAGHKAIILEWIPETMEGGEIKRLVLWVDLGTRLVLKQQAYGGPDGQTALLEYAVTRLVVDPPDFPGPGFFDLADERFARYNADYLGALEVLHASGPVPTPTTHPSRQRLERVPPPPGFDPSRSDLIFQFPAVYFSGARSAEADPPQVELFADGYFITTLEALQSMQERCERSLDGSKLVFQPSFGSMNRLVWLDLNRPQAANTVSFEFTVGAFALSRDGRWLAVTAPADFSYIQGGTVPEQQQVTVVDLERGTIRSIPLSSIPHAPVWSRDGRRLAVLVEADPQNGVDALEIDVETGKVVERRRVGLDLILAPGQKPGWPGDEWPANAWTSFFNEPPSTLETCVSWPLRR